MLWGSWQYLNRFSACESSKGGKISMRHASTGKDSATKCTPNPGRCWRVNVLRLQESVRSEMKSYNIEQSMLPR